jgi:NitT/TauT family transport system substrate-binding protein
MTVAFVASGKFIKERPDVAQRFVLALGEAARLMQGDDYLSRPNLDSYMKYTASTEEAIRNGSPVIYDPELKIPVEGLADMERVHRENGRTEYDKPLDISKVVDERLTTKAVELLRK